MWKKKRTSGRCWQKYKTGAVTVENRKGVPPKIKDRNIVHLIRQSPLWACLQRKLNQDLEKIPAIPCSLKHYSQQPKHGNNQSVHQQMNGFKKYVVYTHNGIILFGLKKEGSPAICDNRSEAGRCQAKGLISHHTSRLIRNSK